MPVVLLPCSYSFLVCKKRKEKIISLNNVLKLVGFSVFQSERLVLLLIQLISMTVPTCLALWTESDDKTGLALIITHLILCT